jgi:3D (Asp-Asp-Asp) domain-containing protein
MANNVIDVFVGSYNEAIQLGRRKAKVYIVEDDENETEDIN